MKSYSWFKNIGAAQIKIYCFSSAGCQHMVMFDLRIYPVILEHLVPTKRIRMITE